LTVYKLLEILNRVKNKDLPVTIGQYSVEQYSAIQAMPFPDDLNPDDEEGACFTIFCEVAPDTEEGDSSKKVRRCKPKKHGKKSRK
jgi:hypothetical protein